ncbi:hypothetical protein TRP8649_00610 [Pelagimonas phthalicica]|uniref:DUF1127 domain-containing protein n=1 Tax=Pelagimonas phthalicica TaxID=1037362 RepID=A0A238J781_9RHOB|nr:hypothetical protein [Pelagimonas phthalicica]TDS94946.1 hypothetical protein CLV87_1463 [Pelagimonas phthalicica]SMX26528.1 hypothetical protein TRP8649_00610 [Pelagimonas phthalicica]
MTHDRSHPLRRRGIFARLLTLLHALRLPRTTPTTTDIIDGLPEGMSDHHLRDIGLDPQQIYLYKHRPHDPRGF